MKLQFKFKQLRNAGVILALTLLAACGIDQGDSRIDTPAPTLPTAQTTYGSITGFGSILVNGLTIEVTDAAILIDGFPATEADLNIGQIVRVLSLIEADQTNAFLVEYQENAVGPIANLDAGSGTFTLLDLQVQTDINTMIDVAGATVLADLAENDVVQVSAFVDQAGILRASYIGDAAANNILEISTSITAVDTAAQTFTLGTLVVDYSQAQLIDLPNGEPVAGLVVEVEGLSLNANGQLEAGSIIALAADPGIFSASDTSSESDALSAAAAAGFDGLDASFLGFINTTNLPDSITVGDVEIAIDGNTIIDNGVANDLVTGLFIQVNGEVTALGNVRATRITIL